MACGDIEVTGPTPESRQSTSPAVSAGEDRQKKKCPARWNARTKLFNIQI
jgi:hypothetical protein